MAVTPVALQANYGDLYGSGSLPVLEELFRASLEQFPPIYEDLFKVIAHDREIWQATELHDLPAFNVVPEGSEYAFARAKEGAAKTLTIQKFGLGVSINGRLAA